MRLQLGPTHKIQLVNQKGINFLSQLLLSQYDFTNKQVHEIIVTDGSAIEDNTTPLQLTGPSR